jgi:hypothetical protein
MPPWVLRIRNWGRASSRGSQPIPAFMVRPKTSPLGHSSSISGVSGSRPAGPVAFVSTSSRAAPVPTIASNPMAILAMLTLLRDSGFQRLSVPRFADRMTPRHRRHA